MRDRLDELLVAKRPALRALVAREARGLLRYQSADDLVQTIHLRALEKRDRFQDQGEDAFVGWLFTVARRVLADRRAHWAALKRRSGRLLRYTSSVTHTADPRAVAEPPGHGTGPSTFAARREQIVLATKALDLLMERDQKLVRWSSEGVDSAELAARLDLSETAVRQARKRAFDRFRKAFQLVAGTDLPRF